VTYPNGVLEWMLVVLPMISKRWVFLVVPLMELVTPLKLVLEPLLVVLLILSK
jgi:hypothetical protein